MAEMWNGEGTGAWIRKDQALLLFYEDKILDFVRKWAEALQEHNGDADAAGRAHSERYHAVFATIKEAYDGVEGNFSTACKRSRKLCWLSIKSLADLMELQVGDVMDKLLAEGWAWVTK
jgi:hypothetical protein